MLERQVLDCPVCGASNALSVVYHEHGVVAADGNVLVTVVDYRCEASVCAIADDELVSRRDERP